MKTKITIIVGIVLFLIAAIACGDNLKAKDIAVKKLIQKSRANMVYIPGGTYMMDRSIPEAQQTVDDYPPHKVKLSSFYISKYNTSYGEYDVYTKSIGRPYIQMDDKKINAFYRSADYPVDEITWQQANNYCQWLRKESGLPYDLPTEAQWEYVARNLGKKNWVFATNDGTQKLCKNFPCEKQYKNQKGNITKDFFPLPVGSIPCTPMGICGLNGEVGQWMKDWYGRDYYQHSPIDNPQGPNNGTKKVSRGSAALDDPSFALVFNRYGNDPNKGLSGFRCVINTDILPSKLGAYANNK